MKKIGIIGGLGPESTVDYYRGIIDAFRQRESGLTAPEMIIYSADVAALLEMMEKEEWERLIDWLDARIQALHRAGAEFAVIGANTPHIVFNDVRKRSPIPMLSIVEATCREAELLKVKTVGLMGTKFTMQSDFYGEAFYEKGISIVIPEDDEIALIQDKLMSEIELGIIKDATRKQLLAIAKRMIDDDFIEALILGCTELPLILDRDEYGIPFLNTTAIHVKRIVRYCLEP